jgi:hypothetical protein
MILSSGEMVSEPPARRAVDSRPLRAARAIGSPRGAIGDPRARAARRRLEMNTARTKVLLSLALALPACSRSTPAEPAPPAPTVAVTLQDAGPRTDQTLFGLLGAEAARRPSLSPSADDVYAALEKAGQAVGDRKQSLGRTYEAAYCTGGYTKDAALAIDVCEYPDDMSAAAGLERARTLFPGMANRSVYGHKATLLTIIEQKAGPAADERAKKIAAVYMSL